MNRLENGLIVAQTRVGLTKKMLMEKFKRSFGRKKEAFSTVEAILLIIVIVALVFLFKTSATTFVTNMFTKITEAAEKMFPTT